VDDRFDVTRSRLIPFLLIGATLVVVAGELFMIWMWSQPNAHVFFGADGPSQHAYVVAVPVTVVGAVLVLVLLRWRLRVDREGMELTAALGIRRSCRWQQITDVAFLSNGKVPVVVIKGPDGRVFARVSSATHNFRKLIQRLDEIGAIQGSAGAPGM